MTKVKKVLVDYSFLMRILNQLHEYKTRQEFLEARLNQMENRQRKFDEVIRRFYQPIPIQDLKRFVDEISKPKI